MAPDQNRTETVLMRGHNMFCGEFTDFIPEFASQQPCLELLVSPVVSRKQVIGIAFSAAAVAA